MWTSTRSRSPPRRGPTWEALLAVAEGSFAGGGAPRFARALGCEDPESAGPRPLALGSTIPGFHVAVAEPASELALAGRHRFSRYALVFHLDERSRGAPGSGPKPGPSSPA